MLPVIAFPVIDPVLVSIGPFAIRWYALAYVAGILLGWFYANRLVSAEALWRGGAAPLTRRDLDDFVIWVTLGVVLGGRLGYVLFYNPGHYLENPVEIVMVWRGGMAFHGGFLGVLVAIAGFALRHRLPLWSLADSVCAAVPLGIFFGRLANFINAELYGRVADVPWAMVFPGAGPDPRHPSQLYQAALEGLALFLILRLLTHRLGALKSPGLVTGAFVAGYGLCRIIGEQFREPDAHIGFLTGGLTMGVLLSLPMLAFGFGLMVWARRRSAGLSGEDA